jgi:hypothetical protein
MKAQNMMVLTVEFTRTPLGGEGDTEKISRDACFYYYLLLLLLDTARVEKESSQWQPAITFVTAFSKEIAANQIVLPAG